MSQTRENTYAFYVSSADPDDDPVWVDLTDRVREDEQPMSALTGRQNDLAEADAGRFVAQLDNDNDDFTYGNDASPYASWWGPGRKCQLRETVAGQELNMWTGYLETPTESIETAQVTDDENELTLDRKRVSITAIDRMGRLETAESFPSTLAAHIVGSARNGCLAGYWPLLDAVDTFRPVVGSVPARVVIATGSTNPAEVWPHVEPQGGVRLPGDDATPALMVPGLNVGALAWVPELSIDWSGNNPPSLAAGQALTEVLWFNQGSTNPLSSWPGVFDFSHTDGVVSVQRTDSGSADYFRVTSPLGTLTGSADGTAGIAEGTDRYYIVAIRFGYTPNTLELWIDDQTFTATLSGSYAGPTSIFTMLAMPLGSVAHWQLYVGDPSDFTNADFLAQREVGLLGLERQTTGDRIRSIARYAGIPESEWLIDPGQAIMQRASLAGKTPLTAMREAEAVERGLLYVDGSGRLVFKDRRTLYNV